MNNEPSAAVAPSHQRISRMSLRWPALTASTIVSDDASSTNDVTDVNGMSKRSDARIALPCRMCPLTLGVPPGRFLYSMYVEMSPPNIRHSEPRNTHMPNFSLVTPVFVGG